MDTTTIPTIYPKSAAQRHENPVVQALAIITDHFKPADDQSDFDLALSLADVYDILHRYTAQFVDDPGMGTGYGDLSPDDRAQIAHEAGAEDGWIMRQPRYRASDHSTEANVYRAAYRDAADDRIREVMA